MDHIGIDVHKKESQLCILSDRPRARILLEASTESEWVARCLERLGHEVIVADPAGAGKSARLLTLGLPRRRTPGSAAGTSSRAPR